MSVLNKLSSGQSVADFLSQNKNYLVVLFFAAEWSDESKLMGQVLEELSKEEKYAKVLCVLQVEAEDNEELCLKHGIDAVPAFLFLKGQETLHRVSGANPAELRTKLNQLVSTPSLLLNKSDAAGKEDLNERLKNLINSAPVILFMKGSPQEPRCGFSRQIIEILKNEKAAFSFFDILADNEVREGLKKYSNWPTYPQLYVKGELVGGLDIVKELVQSGEFAALLPAAKAPETIDDRLKKLINQSKIMLFMKGSPSEPQCGFSRQIIALLNESGHKYGTFDILSDEEVRQSLKEFSKWPTYPQLYVDGELVGGLDIVKELKESNELDSTLKGK